MKPRIYFPPETSDEERERVIRGFDKEPARQFGSMSFQEDGVVITYVRVTMRCPICACEWPMWMPDDLRVDVAGLLYSHPELKRCRACEPDPSEMTAAERSALVRKLAHTDAVDEMYVEIDKAQAEGRSDPERYHNPDDVKELTYLRMRFEQDPFKDVSLAYDEPRLPGRESATITIKLRGSGFVEEVEFRAIVARRERMPRRY